MKIKINNKKVGVPNKALASAIRKHKSSFMRPKKGKGSYKRQNRKVDKDLSIFFILKKCLNNIL